MASRRSDSGAGGRVAAPPDFASSLDGLYPPLRRRFLSEGSGAAIWAEIAPLFAELERRPLGSPPALEEWLLDRSELESAIDGEAARRDVAAACHTDDREAESRHREYVAEVMPEVEVASDRLDRRYLAAAPRRALPPERWRVLDRDVALAVRLFREANVPLHVREEELALCYGQIQGAMTVELRGRTWTLPALAALHEDPDRGTREDVWRRVAARRLQDAERLGGLFEELLALRRRMAANAGFGSYRDFRHLRLGRHDYAPEDCLALHEQIRRHAVPLLLRMHEERRRRLGLAALRPWDLAADLDGRPAFEPFRDQAGQVAVAARILEHVDGGDARSLRWLESRGLLDLETRPHKRPGGFVAHLEDERVPFIFGNCGTTHDDVMTLLHETGHAVHYLAARELEPLEYRSAPLEFSEVASMGMELLAAERLHHVYPLDEARRAARDGLEDVVLTLCRVAVVDAFQHWLYLHPDHDAEARGRRWAELQETFEPGLDWTGLERERAADWQRHIHLFEEPLYYVEYGLAQIGALQLWRSFRRDPQQALRPFRDGLALGGSRPLPDLYAAAGLRFDPRGELLPELMAEVEAAWRPTCQPSS